MVRPLLLLLLRGGYHSAENHVSSEEFTGDRFLASGLTQIKKWRRLHE